MAQCEAPDGDPRVDVEGLAGLLHHVDEVARPLAHALKRDGVGHGELEGLPRVAPARHEQAGGLLPWAALAEVHLPVEPVSALPGEIEQASARALNGALRAAKRLRGERIYSGEGRPGGGEVPRPKIRLRQLLERPAAGAVASHVLLRHGQRVLPLAGAVEGPRQAPPGILVARPVEEGLADRDGHGGEVALLLGLLALRHGLPVRVIRSLGTSDRHRGDQNQGEQYEPQTRHERCLRSVERTRPAGAVRSRADSRAPAPNAGSRSALRLGSSRSAVSASTFHGGTTQAFVGHTDGTADQRSHGPWCAVPGPAVKGGFQSQARCTGGDRKPPPLGEPAHGLLP